MKRGYDILSDIENYFETFISEHPDIELGNNIFYMNGEDGTDFDWDMNGRCCEFCMFYKNSEEICIQVFVHSNDTMSGVYFKNDGSTEELEEGELDKGAARYLASLMLQEADDKNLFDQPLSAIDFDAEIENMLSDARDLDDMDDMEDYEEEDEDDY